MIKVIWDEDTQWILGRPCFAIADIARVLRLGGQEIKTRAEDEQAAAIFWMLGQYEKHGKDWRKKGDEELRQIVQEAKK